MDLCLADDTPGNPTRQHLQKIWNLLPQATSDLAKLNEAGFLEYDYNRKKYWLKKDIPCGTYPLEKWEDLTGRPPKKKKTPPAAPPQPSDDDPLNL